MNTHLVVGALFQVQNVGFGESIEDAELGAKHDGNLVANVNAQESALPSVSQSSHSTLEEKTDLADIHLLILSQIPRFILLLHPAHLSRLWIRFLPILDHHPLLHINVERGRVAVSGERAVGLLASASRERERTERLT